MKNKENLRLLLASIALDDVESRSDQPPPDDEILFRLIDGDLTLAEHDSIMALVDGNPAAHTRLRELLEIQERVEAEPKMTRETFERRVGLQAPADKPDLAAALSDALVALFQPFFETLELAQLDLATVVRNTAPVSPEARDLIGRWDGIQFQLRIEPDEGDPDICARLRLDADDASKRAGDSVELIERDGTMLESCPLDRLPVTFEIPQVEFEFRVRRDGQTKTWLSLEPERLRGALYHAG